MDFHTSKSLKYVPDLRDMIIFNPKFHFFFFDNSMDQTTNHDFERLKCSLL